MNVLPNFDHLADPEARQLFAVAQARIHGAAPVIAELLGKLDLARGIALDASRNLDRISKAGVG